jgi:hypothetical protein
MANENTAFSCDTFVVLPPLTDSNFRIFGKNSDRPANEVQEIIFVSNEHTTDNKDYVQVGSLFCFFSKENFSNLFSVLIFKFHKFQKLIIVFYRNPLGVGAQKWVQMNMVYVLVMKPSSQK